MRDYVCALGELLIDFTYCGKSDCQRAMFEQNPGGAPGNVLAGLSRLGTSTQFIGCVGRDIHGDFLRKTLENEGIGCSNLVATSEAFTTLAFVMVDERGERSFSFARSPGADTCLSVDMLDEALIKNARIFHTGSLSLTHEASKGATLKALELAKENGVIISYDPNYRAALWSSEQMAKDEMRSLLPYCDLLKISLEELGMLGEKTDPEEAALDFLKQGIKCVVVTMGEKGALCAINGKVSHVPPQKAEVVDTTGAGDAFWAGFLHCIMSENIGLDSLENDKGTSFTHFGNIVAARCIEKRGGILAMPYLKDVTPHL